MIKKLFLLLLLLPTLAFGQGWDEARLNVGIVGGGVAAADPCAGYLRCQNFQTATTGYDNSETWTPETDGGTALVYPAYTTGPLRGTQSMRLFSENYRSVYCKSSFTATGEIWGQFLMNIGTGGNFAFYILDVSDNILGQIESSGTYTINAKATGGDTSYGGTAYSIGTAYRVWFYFKTGTGADAIMTVWVGAAAVTTRPASAEASSTNGTVTANATKVQFYSTYGSTLIDYVMVKSSVFTTVPE